MASRQLQRVRAALKQYVVQKKHDLPSHAHEFHT